MSWSRSTFQDQVDAAMNFINNNTVAYSPTAVSGSSRVGCIDSSQCGSGWRCSGGYCIEGDGLSGGSGGDGESSGCGDGSSPGSGGAPGGGGCGGGSGGGANGGGTDARGCAKPGCGSGGGGGGGGGNGGDCCGPRCCRISSAGYVQCFCGDCPPPPSCNQFCSGYSAANGQPAPGCGDGDSCDECSRCVDQGDFQGSKCEPIYDGPCHCENSSCRDCEKCTESGTCVEDCAKCETCVTMYNHHCDCGVATIKCCWSACNGAPDYSKCALEGCEKAGLSDGDCDPPPTCTSHAECPDCFLCGSDGECYPDPECSTLACCSPEQVGAGWRCLPTWEHRIRSNSGDVIVRSYRISSPTITFSGNPNGFMDATYTTALIRSGSSYCHVPERIVSDGPGIAAEIWDNYYVEVIALGEVCYRSCS